MKKSNLLAVVAAFGFLLAGCATSPESLRAVLKKHPDIVLDALAADPAKFAETYQRSVAQMRKQQSEQAEKEAAAQLEEEIKNPKQPEIGEKRAFRGPKDAKITIVTYSDFQCPYCKQGNKTTEELRKKYGNDVRVVFKHLPLSFHPLAMPAAQRFEALVIQGPGIAWKFHDEVFGNQAALNVEGEKFLDKAAKKAGGDVAKMKKDMTSDAVKATIDADMAEAKKFNISGTPGFMVEGVTVAGAYPVAHFVSIIDRVLENKRKKTASLN